MAVPRCSITREPIDVAALTRDHVSSADGAMLLFLGVVRDQNEGRPVIRLDYDAYAGMAERVMEEIVDEARERWRVGEIVAVHRVGKLEIGEASVAVAVAAPHRDEAYTASRYVIDELKKRVPIWKREAYADGESEWLGGDSAGVGVANER